MLANANSPSDSIPLDRNVREVVAICATNGLSYGEPNDLVGFMRALHENKLLAMNFWSLVARLTDKAGPRANEPEWILTTIVEGVTNRTPDEVRSVGPAHRVLVNRLAGMLAGEDVLEPVPDIPPLAPMRAPVEAPAIRQPKLTDTIVPARTARLADVAELTPRQSRTSAALASAQATRETPPVAPIINSAHLREDRPRLVLEPEQPVATVPTEAVPEQLAAQEESPITIPLSSYAESNSRPAISGGLLAGGLVLILLIALATWFAFNRDSAPAQNFESSLRSGYESMIASLTGTHTQTSAANNQNAAPAATPTSNTPPAPSPANSPASSPAPQRTGISRPAAAPIRNEALPAIPPAPIVRRAPESESFDPNADLSEGGGSRVVVPPAVMQDYLISSRVPIYPEEAKANSITGPVVMEAVVNRDGSVGRLRVVSGDPALRRAAVEAVSAWRYRPYLLNGEPVDVSTTISVDFSSNN